MQNQKQKLTKSKRPRRILLKVSFGPTLTRRLCPDHGCMAIVLLGPAMPYPSMPCGRPPLKRPHGLYRGSRPQWWPPSVVAAHRGGRPQGWPPAGVAARRGDRPQGWSPAGVAVYRGSRSQGWPPAGVAARRGGRLQARQHAAGFFLGYPLPYGANAILVQRKPLHFLVEIFRLEAVEVVEGGRLCYHEM
jgi:hypothetical protein